ncbi:hypothetical protein BDR07DRAFT_1496632 [Suillus spraguei]|nr:hypothetical protein BDR07DRAFT_1496632 [Suillus spraguei]
MQSVEPSICQVGSLLQWSADTTEHAHITQIKDPADSSNNINYDAQICQFLDHREKCQNFQIAMSIIAHSQSQSQASTSQMTDAGSEHHDKSHDEDPHTDNSDLQTEQLSSDIEAARPLCTIIVGVAAIHLNFDPSIQCIPVDVVAEKFSLPDLGQHRALPDAPLPFNDLMVWFKVRVQQASYHSPSITPPALTVNMYPSSTTWKYGHYDTAIFTVDDTGREQWPTSGLKGHDVVEVHLIMQPLPPQGKPGSAPWSGHWLSAIIIPLSMPVTSNLTGMALPALYSKLSKSSKSWLPKSPSRNLIPPPQCVQLEKVSCSLYNHVPTETELQDKQILEDLKTAVKTRLRVQFTDLDNPDSLSLG